MMSDTGRTVEGPSDPRPTPPPAPGPDECCQSGCEPCVYDLYWQAVERYERALAEWEARQAKTGAGVNGSDL
jgi:hypothetical protein